MLLRCSERQVVSLIRNGTVPAVRLGSSRKAHYRIPVARFAQALGMTEEEVREGVGALPTPAVQKRRKKESAAIAADSEA